MNISVDMPNKIAEHLLKAWGDLSKAGKESLAIESYRTEKLSVGGVAEMLGLTVMEADAFLKKNGVDLHYSLFDLESDRANLKRVLSR